MSNGCIIICLTNQQTVVEYIKEMGNEQMANETYYGWENYETWNYALWLDNSRPQYDAVREVVKELEGNRNERIYGLSLMLENYAENNMPVVTGFYADILTHAIAKIDFYEIAEHIIDEVDEA